ncbi:hypothetical protein P175DRAFT_0557742 [Aspergillus ochraceoroseus IBT 24754]|uniref:Hydrophobin n=2 Tax=Aspergillus ochraceoroseus TaxID=138278 RepID=A0A2T5LXP8_9EURO|nr:uncharacterized protein P175DRAFT_0557742 [Aspergillus ochraceoroseus IBT 24754]PTU21065.1 hypothetical protein P175DRAFT_0557742 [Aspergillus ochraceoroseus IBT 24754]
MKSLLLFTLITTTALSHPLSTTAITTTTPSTAISDFSIPVSISIPAQATQAAANAAKTKANPASSKIHSTEALAHQIGAFIAHQDADGSSLNPQACPPSHRSKQCCTSVNGMTQDVENELSDVVPLLTDMQVSSILGVQCTAMTAEEPNTDCLDSVMCCHADPKQGGGTQSLLQSSCLPYNEAIADQDNAIAESETQAAASGTPVAVASSSSSSVASARATRV